MTSFLVFITLCRFVSLLGSVFFTNSCSSNWPVSLGCFLFFFPQYNVNFVFSSVFHLTINIQAWMCLSVWVRVHVSNNFGLVTLTASAFIANLSFTFFGGVWSPEEFFVLSDVFDCFQGLIDVDILVLVFRWVTLSSSGYVSAVWNSSLFQLLLLNVCSGPEWYAC